MLIIFLIYIGIGVVLNFTPPLKRKIWVAQMNAASSDNATVVIRLGVVVFYPLFLLKR